MLTDGIGRFCSWICCLTSYLNTSHSNEDVIIIVIMPLLHGDRVCVVLSEVKHHTVVFHDTQGLLRINSFPDYRRDRCTINKLLRWFILNIPFSIYHPISGQCILSYLWNNLTLALSNNYVHYDSWE